MTIVCVVFDYLKNDYKTMFSVLKKSIAYHIPDAKVILVTDMPQIEVNERINKHKKYKYASFRAKMEVWASMVDIDDDIVFMDADMVLDGDISHVFKSEFDIAVTVRRHKKKNVNSGIVFVKNTKRAKGFIRTWCETDRRMYQDKDLHDLWSKKYEGMNQASLGYMLHHYGKVSILCLPCVVYNSCEIEWKNMNRKTCVIHLKTPLRDVIQGKDSIVKTEKKYRGATRAYEIWRKYYEM